MNRNEIKKKLYKPISSCSLCQYFLQISFAKKRRQLREQKKNLRDWEIMKENQQKKKETIPFLG
jgi:hypothetical protein